MLSIKVVHGSVLGLHYGASAKLELKSVATESKKRWLIKDAQAHVRGPFTTDDVLRQITDGELSGDEMVALFPGNEWIAISKDPQFYDRLLELLEHEQVRTTNKTGERPQVNWDDDTAPRSVKSESPPPPKQNRAERVSKTRFGDEEDPIVLDNKNSEETRENRRPKSASKEKKSPDIELKSRSKVLRKKQTKSATPAVILITAAMALVLYFLFGTSSAVDTRIHLLVPRKGQPPLTAEQIKERQKAAVASFDYDNFSNYLQSEQQLVQILEGDPKNSGVIALLCLNYLELWNFSKQDSQDLSAITSAVQSASAIDPAGNEAATCRVVDLLSRGRYIEAKSLTETVLDTVGTSAQPPVGFYYLKARILEVGKDPISAISYAQSAEQLWPQWLRLFSLEARLQAEAKNYVEAAKRYRQVLKSNPLHQVAQIELGVLEMSQLNDAVNGKTRLEAAFSMTERSPQDVMSRGYLELAEQSLKSTQNATALKYARLAYSANSLDPRAKEIILQLGGEKTLLDTHVEDTQLIYEGDQLLREGDLNSAQAHYKEAYRVNKHNGIAAMKAAECLWDLSLSSEAIEWLNNAIKADPKLVDAYVLLADYFSQRFNYEAAGQVLNKAQSQAPKSYKVMGGFALVEMRRHNSQGALNYAQRAIALYESDVDAYVIMTQALMNLQQYAKAFDAASHAIEIDLNNRKAQIAYANALGSVRGAHAGIDYLSRLVATYPTITEYRLALGDAYFLEQSYSAAQNIYEEVIKIEDKPKRAYINLGRSEQMQGHYEDALNAFFEAAKLDPADVEPLYMAGLLYLDAKKPSDARTQFQRVLKINKDYPLVNYQIGRADLMMDSPAEALEQAKLEKAKNPNMADPYILAADSYTSMKQYSLCASEYQNAVKLRPQGADIYVKMARCYRLSGDIDASLSMIVIANDQESGNPEVWKEQGAIYETHGDRVKAIEAYNQYIVLAPNAADRDQVQGRINNLSH